MRVLHLDWEALLGFMDPWQELSTATRRLLLDSKPKGMVERRAIADDLPRLLDGRFMVATSSELRAQLSGAFHEAHKALRAMDRHRLLQHADRHSLREYLTDHFTRDEREGLCGPGYYGWDHDGTVVTMAASAGHLRGFLGAKNRHAWEKERLPRRGGYGDGASSQRKAMLIGKMASDDLGRLVETLCATEGPIPFHALAERMGSLKRSRLGHALEAGLRYLLFFPALDAELVPVLTLWPGVAERLRRVAPLPPERVTPEESLCVATRMEDLTQLLVRAAEPMRLKANGRSLFVAVERELERGLLPLPAWLTHPSLFPENAPTARIHHALNLAQRLGFVAETRTGRELGLLAAPAGWQWLDRSPHERLRKLLDLFRPVPVAPGRKRSSDREPGPDPDLFGTRDEVLDELDEFEEGLGDEFDDELVPFGRFDALSDESLFGPSGHGLALSAIKVYATLEPGRPVSFHAFLSYHAAASNPFLHDRPGVERFRQYGLGGYGNPVTEEHLEELWIQGLRRILHLFLLPFGGVCVGNASVGGLTIELTSVGRYLLGLAPDYSLAVADTAKAPVRVQPDFDVVFVAASPSLEAAISRFAERRGAGVGVLFRITRDSILRAAQFGLEAEEVLTILTEASTTAVPANVAHEVRAWFGCCRRLSVESVQLLRCPDAATATRVLAAAGTGRLEVLSDTVLALTDPQQRSAVVRACRKAGLFLTSAPEEQAGARSKARRRRN